MLLKKIGQYSGMPNMWHIVLTCRYVPQVFILLSVDMIHLQDMPLIPDLDDVEVVALTPDSVNSSPQWLQRWLQATQGAPMHCCVPPVASVITTPLVPSAWHTMLVSHPQRALVHFLHGITTGFRVGYNLPSTALKYAKKHAIWI